MSAETSHATPARAEDKTPPKGLGAMAGAMFLMATSAIGPGFLTQTSVFTVQMGASFAFAIMLSILVDIAIQLNVWRVLCVTGMRANTLGNTVLPGLGWVLAGFVFFGGAIFNIGNIAGAGLGLNAMLGIDARIGGVIVILMGLMFLGVVGQRGFTVRWRPAAGLRRCRRGRRGTQGDQGLPRRPGEVRAHRRQDSARCAALRSSRNG